MEQHSYIPATDKFWHFI